MEDVDTAICKLLAEDGRMSFTELGKRTGLSTSAVHQRVKRLELRGAIKSYVANIDPGEFGLTLTAFVSIRPIDASQPDDDIQLSHAGPDLGRRRGGHGRNPPGVDQGWHPGTLANLPGRDLGTRCVNPE